MLSILVEANEEGCCLVCFEVFDLSTSESQTPKTSMFNITIAACGVEMGAYHDGLCVKRARYYLGYG